MSRSELQLGASERVLWSGAPERGLMFRRGDLFLIPFSLMWGGFAFFWEASVVRTDGPFFMKLWGIPFVLVGIYLIVGRFFHDAWRRSRTLYAVTNERIVILTGGNEKSLSLKTLAELSLKVRADGAGTITFGSSPFGAYWNMGFSWPGVPQVPAFENIPDVRTVHEVIRRAQKEAP